MKINGNLISEPTFINPGDRFLFGSHIYYLFINPKINKDATYDYDEAVKEANKETLQINEKDDQIQRELDELKEKLRVEQE